MARGALLMMVLLVAGCDRQADWTGFVYPEVADLTVSVEIGRFESFEQCRVGATRTLATFDRQDSGTFECGRACRHDSRLNLAVCAETRD